MNVRRFMGANVLLNRLDVNACMDDLLLRAVRRQAEADWPHFCCEIARPQAPAVSLQAIA
jgi:hypothetical protein